MNIVLSFIGTLPKYILYCIFQIRIYSTLPIYLIYNDYKSEYIKDIINMNVVLIDYKNVNNNCKLLNSFMSKFRIQGNLGHRSKLFFRSFERIYLVRNLMLLHNLKNVFHLEIDNLVYDDISNWINKFISKKVTIAFMIDNKGRAAVGMCYFKDHASVTLITHYFDNTYLPNYTGSWRNEMGAIWDFYNSNKKVCYIMPTLHVSEPTDLGTIMYKNYGDFNTVFDPSTYGIYLLGYDIIHTGGKIVLHKKNRFGYITPSNIKWIITNGNKKPYIVTNSENILINNLHVHSKDLINGLSSPYI